MKAKRSNRGPYNDLWINPHSNLRGPDGDRSREQGNITPDAGARFLELADIALGLKKPQLFKKPSVPVRAIHVHPKRA
jgi:hypothetical protein